MAFFCTSSFLHFALFFKGFPFMSSFLWLMTPISSTLPMSSPLFYFLVGFCGVLLPPWWHQDPWHPLWFYLLYFCFWEGRFKQGCSACRCAPKIRVRLGGFWYPLVMFCSFGFVAFPPFEALGNSSSFFIPPLWEFLKDFWVWGHWNALKPILIVNKWLSLVLVGAQGWIFWSSLF